MGNSIFVHTAGIWKELQYEPGRQVEALIVPKIGFEAKISKDRDRQNRQHTKNIAIANTLSSSEL